ncbi:MAG: aldo/keto reductase family oxidoreductase [Anaerolineales bacterium]
METMNLGNSPLRVSRVGLGCMRLSADRREAIETIRAALDAGISFFDHADIYGRGQREETFSAIWDEVPALRSKVIVQSKCGIRFAGEPYEEAPQRYDFGYEHIMAAVEGSLTRLKTDYLDVLLLHRPDALVEPEEVARAFDRLHEQGKVLHFGVSNQTAAQMRLLQEWVDQPLVANQLQLSVVHTHLIDEGIVMNRSDYPAPRRNEGTLEFCRLHNITIQAWSPLAAGAITGKPLEEPDLRLERAAEVVAEMAAKYGVSGEAIMVAWLLRHPAGIQPLIGTTNPARITGACEGAELKLSREEWYRLFEAGRGRRLP